MKTDNDFLDDIFNADPVWLSNYRNKRCGQLFDRCTFFGRHYLDQQLGQLSSLMKALLLKDLKEAWRQRRATLRRKSAARFDHKITISFESEEYLRDLCRRTDKSISNAIDDLLMKEVKKKQKSKGRSKPSAECERGRWDNSRLI